jgi:hypothetical protein
VISQRFRLWGETETETGWLRRAGFTRRNTRRAILTLLRKLLWDDEHILVITTGTYKLQMGYLALTNRRVIVGMSWPFIPFIKKHLGIPLETVRLARRDHNPWGAKVEVFSQVGKFAFGDLENGEADELAALITAGAQRAIARQPAPPPPGPPAPNPVVPPPPSFPSPPTP